MFTPETPEELAFQFDNCFQGHSHRARKAEKKNMIIVERASSEGYNPLLAIHEDDLEAAIDIVGSIDLTDEDDGVDIVAGTMTEAGLAVQYPI